MAANRILLWGLYGTFMVYGNVALFPDYFEYEHGAGVGGVWDGVFSGFLLLSLAMVWIAFFPPALYERWISGSSPAHKAADI